MIIDPLKEKYKEQFPGISDSGAELQVMLYRLAEKREWKLKPGSFYLIGGQNDE